MQQLFQAMVVREEPGNIFIREIKEKSISELPDHDVLIAVHFSSLNHKDALSASGNKGVTRRYPHTPGVDAAGIVMESRSEKFKAGDEVIVTGFELGTKNTGRLRPVHQGPGGMDRASSPRHEPLREHDLRHGRLYGSPVSA